MSSLFSCFGPRKPTDSADKNGGDEYTNEKSATAQAPARPVWEAQLPKPAADATISSSFSSVFDSIDAYVDKFYRDKTSEDLDATHEACLTLVGTPHLPSSLTDLLQSNRPNPLVCRPTALIKHSIAYMIQQAMTMDEGGRNSLLPPWATSLPQALKGQEHSDEAAFSQAFAHWRVLTAFLQPPNAATNPLAKQSRTSATRAIADRITGAFAPWESMPGAPEQRAELVAICEEAASAGSLLFAQPSVFQYSWTPVDLAEGEEARKVAVVKPGLVKKNLEGGSETVVVQARHVPLSFPEGFVAV